MDAATASGAGINPSSQLNFIGPTVTITVTNVDTPAAPTLDNVSAGSLSLTATVTPGADGGAPITNYEYSTDGGATWKLRTDGGGNSTSILITVESNSSNPLSVSSYNVRIRAVNSEGSGAQSNQIAQTPNP